MQYRLKALIAVGTFAEVWHAERVDENGKPCAADVALKIGCCHIEDERTRGERAVLYRIAPLQHSGTIRILDITHINGRLTVAMELAEENLFGRLHQRRSAAELMRFLTEVAVTVDDLNGRGLLHGGINPTDLLILGGHAKIADFGPLPYDTTARIPFYKAVCMAPELRQAKPERESDQFALAATYAWLRLHHSALPVMRGGELPSGFDFALLAQAEKEVLLTALDPRPKHRFHSCCAFVEALLKNTVDALSEDEVG
jgi:serine/threonine protein kinase